MTKEPTRAEYKQLRDLLIKYIEHKKEKYSWFSTDEINWLIEEIEENDLEMISGKYGDRNDSD